MTGLLLGGIDVGTTNTKVGVYDAAGANHAMVRFATPGDGEALVTAVYDALASCVREVGRPPQVVGIASMAETGVALDRGHRPLHPLLRWDDPRGSEEVEQVAAEIGAARLFDLSGANLGVKTPVVRWRWLARHDRATFTAMRTWVGAGDLVATALTGEPVTDSTLAARTGAFDLRLARFDDQVLAVAGMTADRLPRVVPAGTVAGTATAIAAERCGLPTGTPVVVAGHDHLVGAYAAGVRQPGEVADSLGTAEAVVTVADQPPPAASAGGGVSYNRTADGRWWALLSGLPGAGRLVDWCRDNLLGGSYDAFPTLADTVADRPTGIVVEPYPWGRAAPEPDPDRRLAFHGITVDHTAGDVAYAVLEALCLQTRWVASSHADISGIRPRQVTVFGGPTRNQAWLTAKADTFPAAVTVVPVPDAVCVGAALLAARAAGLTPDEPVLPHVPASADPAKAARYTRLYNERFLPVVRA